MTDHKPPKSIQLKWLILLIAAFLFAIALGVRFATPIHDTIAKLVPATPQEEQTSASITYYTCGMHPWIVLPKPGVCPICGMTLVPIDPNKFTGQISIDPVVVQNIGVRIAPVTQGPLVKTIRTVGTVDYNETAVRDINTKVSGWIEKLNVDYLGAKVKAGDPLFSLYSPDLYAAQEEYLLAWRNNKSNPSPMQDNLLTSARTKLQYFDITDKQIAELQTSDKPAKTMMLRSPYSGVVIEKHANEGMKVDPGMRVFRIADLSTVWVIVTLYEYQLPYVQVGQSAVMTLSYIPGQTFTGKVIYMYPYLQNKTRQVNVRLEFDNPTDLLKPGMYANIALRNELAANRTLVPRSAVIDTGRRQVAFVSLGNGKFEPRNVKLGIETQDGQVEVLDGLKAGEMVVTSGQFLLDSEAKIRASLARMIKGNLASDQKAVAEIAGVSGLNALPDALAKQLTDGLHAYLKIGNALFHDQLDDMANHAKTIATMADRITQITIPGHEHFWHQHEETATIGGKAAELSQTTDLKTARSLFADLSIALGSLLKATGVPPQFEMPLQQLHCPMYRSGQGGNLWFQTDDDVYNPFFGVNSTMPGCYDKRVVLPVTGAKAPSGDDKQDKQKLTMPMSKVMKQDQQQVDALVKAYLAIQKALADDKTQTIADNISALHKAAMALTDVTDPAIADVARAITQLPKVATDDLDAVRDQFKTLSTTVIQLVKLVPPQNTVASSLYEAYCPMVKAPWLQTGDSIHNPYYGSDMLTCGSIRQQITLASDGKE